MSVEKYTNFLKRNIGALITLLAGVAFLIIRLAFPKQVSGNPADVLLMVVLPLLVICYIILFKIEEQKDQLEKAKEEILKAVGYKFILFETKKDCDDYYQDKLMKSSIIHDLTWAETFSNNHNHKNNLSLLEIIKSKNEVNEIFIFSVNKVYRQDRLLKLKTIYEFLKSNGEMNYSCSYYEETKFERLQFTIFDEKEVLFTSSYAQRFSIQEIVLTSLLMKYFEQACRDGVRLIDGGRIVNEAKILELLENLHKH